MSMTYQPTTIVGIDPGVSTGIAVATLWNTDIGRLGHDYIYSSATCTEPHQVWEYIRSPVDIVIIERFSAQLISKYGIHTVEIIGGVRALCCEHNITLIEDTPAQRNPYMEFAERLVTRDTTVARNDQRHEIDAMAHVVRYLVRHGHLTSLKVPT